MNARVDRLEQKQNASQTATRALNRIADIGRWILVVCTIGTVCLLLLTAGAGYMAWSLISARNAVASSIGSMELHQSGNHIEYRRK